MTIKMSSVTSLINTPGATGLQINSTFFSTKFSGFSDPAKNRYLLTNLGVAIS